MLMTKKQAIAIITKYAKQYQQYLEGNQVVFVYRDENNKSNHTAVRFHSHNFLHYTATTMLANSEFVALLKQANTDSSKMAEVIGVSEAQLRFVTNTASGMGLIKCGSVVIPFDNQISKDTDLYKLYNTNIHEKIEMMKKQAEN